MTALLLPRFWPPQHWAARKRLRDPAEALWSELRMARGEIEGIDLEIRAIEHCDDASASRGETFRHFGRLLDDWVARGLVAAIGRPARYRLQREYMSRRSPPPPPAPRRTPLKTRTQRQRLWSAMRVLRSFDLTTLVITAEASPANARTMIDVLERGGWLIRTAEGWSTAAPRRWGPVAPTWSRDRENGQSVIRITDNRDGSQIVLRGPGGPRRSRSAADRSDGGVG